MSWDCLFIKLTPGASTVIRLKQRWSPLNSADAAPETRQRGTSKEASARAGGTLGKCTCIVFRINVIFIYAAAATAWSWVGLLQCCGFTPHHTVPSPCDRKCRHLDLACLQTKYIKFESRLAFILAWLGLPTACFLPAAASFFLQHVCSSQDLLGCLLCANISTGAGKKSWKQHCCCTHKPFWFGQWLKQTYWTHPQMLIIVSSLSSAFSIDSATCSLFTRAARKVQITKDAEESVTLSCRNEAFCQETGGRRGAAGLCWEREMVGMLKQQRRGGRCWVVVRPQPDAPLSMTEMEVKCSFMWR